ncbi:hydroxymethylglutaryl-CoA synthase [Vagococcus sp. JNUCC 83]
MVGIDKINFYTPNTCIDLEELATHRGVDPAKFTIGIGQSKMSVPPISQDTVSMAANAAYPLLTADDLNNIDLIVVGTETGVDESKSVASFIHDLLNIHPFAKSIDLKQACYGATAGLMMAVDFVKLHPDKKALVIGSDISRYGLNSSGEVTQGAGAVAMLISSCPRILEIEDISVSMTKSIFDFWRPNYSKTAIVDGKFSNEAYISFFSDLWNEYTKRTERSLEDFNAFCFHLPYTKMGKKALLPLLERENPTNKDLLLERYQESTDYSRDIGNIYTGSLYLSFMSLIESMTTSLKEHDRIGFFSYGSGAVAEIFSGQLVEGYKERLLTDKHRDILKKRLTLSIDDYTNMFNEELRIDNEGNHLFNQDKTDTGKFFFKGVTHHQRIYGKNKD